LLFAFSLSLSGFSLLAFYLLNIFPAHGDFQQFVVLESVVTHFYIFCTD